MRRKCLAVGIILLFAGTCIIPAQKTDISHDTIPRGGFGLQSNIIVSWGGNETQEPLDPLGTPRLITLDVSYMVLKGLFGQILLFYYSVTKQGINMTIEIIDKPDYCTANISNSYLWFPIIGEFSVQQTNLTVSVNGYAPAFEVFWVKIKASVDTVSGPFGFLPLINGYEQTFTLGFVTRYLPRIIVTPASDYIYAIPGNTSHLPINITNYGNAMTGVFIEIVNHPSGDWLISIPFQIILEVNMSREIRLSVVPPSDFSGIENITITFTPYKADDPTQHGEPVYITIAIICEP
jgi:hypothetical protein